MNDFKGKFLRLLTVAVVMTILVGGLLIARPTYARGQMLRRKNAELERSIVAKEREIAALMENQRRFRTDVDFVERIARQNHRVYPGEIVFIFDRDEKK